MSMRNVLRIGRGDITHWAADAIATSANAGLCGNRTPSYWRFQRRPDNIDGAVHAAAGPALATALSELADARGFPYSSPTSDAASYRGSLLPAATGGIVACPTGSAVHTDSFGLAHTKLVVHAVCPDGIFRTGPPGAAEALLRATYRSALREAVRAGAEYGV
jgi:O-acetyl-ADP-ribose deacetylase (regulator of RNase III)|tara:strand:+ start:376 stop:861 length:486 start_codon:yes stop_codon:yes gene_type:complete